MKVVDLFSGCGGLSLGLQNSGFEVIGAFENWKPAIDIYNLNFTHKARCLDLSNIEESVKEISALNADLIAGGPPCQDFSSAGKRNETLGRADLTISFAKIIDSINPNWFIMENVDRAIKTKAFKEAKEILSTKYGLTQIVLDASLCGVPQKRKRVFLIGKKGEIDGFLDSFLIENLSKKPMSVKEYFGKGIDTEFYYRHARSYARRGVFSVDEPSPTIRGVNRPIPPKYKIHSGDSTKDISQVRPLTFKERASIQTFPEKFKWIDTNKSTLEQIIGNAVPVNLGKFVGNAISNYLKRPE